MGAVPSQRLPFRGRTAGSFRVCAVGRGKCVELVPVARPGSVRMGCGGEPTAYWEEPPGVQLAAFLRLFTKWHPGQVK